MRQLATRLAHGYWETTVGRAMLGLMRLLGPQSEPLPGSRASSAPSTATARSKSPSRARTRFLLHSNAPDVPEGYGEGAFEEILRAAGARAPRVEQQRQDARGTVYRVEWRER